MRKIFSLMMVALFSATMFAADPVTVKSTFTKATVPAEDKVTDLEGKVTWDIATVVGDNSGGDPTYGTGKSNSVEAIKFGNKGTQHFGKVTMSTNYYKDYNVTSVKLYVLNNGTKEGTLTAKQGDVTIGTASQTFGTTWTELEATGTKGNGGKLEVIYEVAQASYWSYIEVTYETAGGGEPTTQTLYLKLSNDWAGWPAKYAMYYFKSANDTQNGWSEFMSAVDGETNMYTGTIPTGYDKVIMVRLNGEATERNWDNKWSQTVNLDVPTNGNNLFTVTSGGTGSECNGTWSKYEAGGAPEPPTPVDSTTLYFVNTKDWTKVQAYLFNDADPWPNYKAWPGEAMIKTGDKALEKDVYKYTFPSAYNTIIFNNKTGDDGEQLANAKWNAAKPYYCDGEWFASLEEIKPVVPAKFYITGNAALVGEEKEWNPGAIKSEKDTLELDLKAGSYMMKLTLNGTWDGENNVKGYDELTEKAEGLVRGTEKNDNNICFELKEAGKVKVIYFVKDTKLTFKLIGDFYVKPVVKKELKLVPGVWAEAEAKIAAWIWGKELAGQWTAFFAGKDTLKAEINADADSIIFMRYNKTVESPLWSEDGNIVWGRMDADTIDYVGLTYTITDWKKGQWTVYVPETPAKFYITGNAALVGEELAWNAKAVKSTENIYTFVGLKANTEYKLKVIEDGDWDGKKVYGYGSLTEKPEGLSEDKDGNIVFKLAEDGDVKVTYYWAEVTEGNWEMTFTVSGNFYVKPVVKKDLYLVPGVWAEGNAKINAWIWGKELAGYWAGYFAPKAENNDTLTLKIDAEADSIIFVRFKADATDPTWEGGEGYIWNTIARDTIDKVGMTYTVTDWSAGQWTPYVAPVYEHEDGYYLMGSHNEWAIDDAYKFTLNETAEGGVEEYKLDVTLTVGQKIKPAYVENDKAKDWYPAEGGDFEVTADYAGAKTVYFRPVRNGQWGAFGGFIYIDANPSTAITNTAVEGNAVKTISNGMLIIEKAGVRYNVMGQIIR